MDSLSQNYRKYQPGRAKKFEIPGLPLSVPPPASAGSGVPRDFFFCTARLLLTIDIFSREAVHVKYTQKTLKPTRTPAAAHPCRLTRPRYSRLTNHRA